MALVRTSAGRSARAALAAALLAAALPLAPWGAAPAQAAVSCTIPGTGGPDVLTGTPGPDVICGRRAADLLDGAGGADILHGGLGEDELLGGAGDDKLTGQEGDDQLEGGPDNDRIRALDGRTFQDEVACGDGIDRVHADVNDVVAPDCEFVRRFETPVAVDDTYPTVEDTQLDLPTTGPGSPVENDTDADGDTLSVMSVSNSVGGLVSLSGGTISFVPTPDVCGPGAGAFDYANRDPRGLSDSGCVTVDITCVDDAPVAVDDEATVTEDDAATPVDVLANDTDVELDAITVASATQPDHGTVVVAGDGSNVTYQPDQDYCNDPPATDLDPFTYTLNGGDEGTVSMTVTCVNDAPDADADPFGDALGNTRFVVGTTSTGPRLTIAGDVLDGDTDVDTVAGSLTAGPATITSTQCAATCTGNVTMEPDGQFVYDPKPGFTGSDTFTYTVNDNDADAPANQTDTATVSITVVGPVVWYVDGDAGSAGDGRSHAPYQTLTALDGAGGFGDADGSGSIIFAYDAASSYAGGLELEGSQNLIGEPHSLDVDPAGTTMPLQEDIVPAGGDNPVLVNASGNGLTLATGNTVQGIDLGNASAAALSGSSVGSATMNSTTPGAIDNQTVGGRAVDISGGTLNMAFSAVSANGGTQGIRLDNTAGTFTADGGTLTDASTTDVAINGGDVNFTYDGTVTDSSGQLVSIANQTGGTKDFNGPIGSGGGISLQSNTASTTTRFDGGLTLSTGSSSGISASSGGTLAITDPGGVGNGVDNTVVTTTGTPLSVTNTTIHDDDLTFRSISSNGAGSGIVLNATGNANGRLVVAGTVGECHASNFTCTGGTIQSSTGPGVSLTAVPGGVSLTRMRVTSGQDDGIRATTVGNGLNLSTSLVSNNGDGVFERGLDYANVTGNVQVATTVVTGSAETNARVANDVAGTTNLSVTDSTFSNNSTSVGAHGLEIRPDNAAAVNATVTGNILSANRDNALLLGNSTGSPSMNLDFIGNTVTGGNGSMLSGQPGVVVAPTAGAVTKVNLNNNTISGTLGRALVVNPLPGSTSSAQLDATVINNTIGNGTALSGSAQGEGMMIRPAGNGDARISIRNNLVRNFAQQGIRVLAQDASAGTASADITMTGNTVQSPGGAGFEGIYVSAGSVSGPPPDNTIMCVDIGGAGALENTFAGTGTGGAPDLGFSKRFATDIRLPGLTAAGGNVATYIQNRNAGSPTVLNYDNPLSDQSGACAQPTLPS